MAAKSPASGGRQPAQKRGLVSQGGGKGGEGEVNGVGPVRGGVSGQRGQVGGGGLAGGDCHSGKKYTLD